MFPVILQLFYIFFTISDFYILFGLGIDLAITHNGYVYHTKYDRAEIIEIGTYQSIGDNILALSIAFARSDLSKVDVSIIFF